MDGATSSAAATERPDGSTRKRPRDIRPGYTPPEEIYKFPRPSLSYGEVVQWKFGFGFIKPDSLGANVFVHASAVRSARELQLGDRVEFERRPAEEGETSDRADNVRSLSNCRHQQHQQHRRAPPPLRRQKSRGRRRNRSFRALSPRAAQAARSSRRRIMTRRSVQ